MKKQSTRRLITTNVVYSLCCLLIMSPCSLPFEQLNNPRHEKDFIVTVAFRNIVAESCCLWSCHWFNNPAIIYWIRDFKLLSPQQHTIEEFFHFPSETSVCKFFAESSPFYSGIKRDIRHSTMAILRNIFACHNYGWSKSEILQNWLGL